MPDALELPGMLGTVVPLMCRERLTRFGRRVVDEFVPLRLGHAFGRRGRFAGGRSGLVPGFAAVIGALDDLTEPPARLRGVDPIGISRRALQVIDFPAREKRPTGIPLSPFAVR